MITHFAMKRPARVSNIDAKQGANTSKNGTTLDIVTPSGIGVQLQVLQAM